MKTLFKAGLVAFLALGLGTAADAATVNVTTVVDEADGSCADGDCSLRDAVSSALPGDTVSIPTGTYVLTLLQIYINKNLTVTGAGARSTIIDGNAASRVFLVGESNQSAIVEISDLTIRNGIGVEDGAFGGIFNQATLTITRCIVTNNHAAIGAGIGNAGNAVIRESAVFGNQSQLAGGILNAGNLTLVNSTISGNTALSEGGSFGGGGGVYNLGAFFFPAPATLTAINSTIASNVADSGSGGGIFSVSAQVSLANTIVSGNTGNDCVSSFDVAQTSDHSLDSDGSCGFTGPGDLSAVDPLLGPLADNGGPTDTHALLAGSPAIDAGSSASCPATDQRGVTRPQGPGCDIGAFERILALTPQGQIEELIDDIEALVAGGALAANNGNPLINKLEGVIGKLDNGEITAACNQLGAFINQVSAYINNGTLTPAQGQALIDAAEAIQANLCGGGPAH